MKIDDENSCSLTTCLFTKNAYNQGVFFSFFLALLLPKYSIESLFAFYFVFVFSFIALSFFSFSSLSLFFSFFSYFQSTSIDRSLRRISHISLFSIAAHSPRIFHSNFAFNRIKKEKKKTHTHTRHVLKWKIERIKCFSEIVPSMVMHTRSWMNVLQCTWINFQMGEHCWGSDA